MADKAAGQPLAGLHLLGDHQHGVAGDGRVDGDGLHVILGGGNALGEDGDPEISLHHPQDGVHLVALEGDVGPQAALAEGFPDDGIETVALVQNDQLFLRQILPGDHIQPGEPMAAADDGVVVVHH